VYGTIGKLNAARDNAILLPSYFDADINGYATFIGHDKALDPSKFFLVITELFGTGRSSSPSNTPSPFDGPRFPVMTIRDNVNAAHQLLTKELHISHLRAVIGFSMGAQQAFQWAVSYPDFMDRIVATAGTAKTYGHGIVRLEGQIAALTTDRFLPVVITQVNRKRVSKEAHPAVPGWSICSMRVPCAGDQRRTGGDMEWLGRDR
jgi:homoserine O-acetyltransferase/O-succinyltransferase